MGLYRHATLVNSRRSVPGGPHPRPCTWSDDARFYVPAARSYAQWFAEAGSALARADGEALSMSFSQDALDAAFKPNHEYTHPLLNT